VKEAYGLLNGGNQLDFLLPKTDLRIRRISAQNIPTIIIRKSTIIPAINDMAAV